MFIARGPGVCPVSKEKVFKFYFACKGIPNDCFMIWMTYNGQITTVRRVVFEDNVWKHIDLGEEHKALLHAIKKDPLGMHHLHYPDVLLICLEKLLLKKFTFAEIDEQERKWM